VTQQLAEEIKYACQEILNRHYSILVSLRSTDEDPWWVRKISKIEQNCDHFLRGDSNQICWDYDFGVNPEHTSANP